MSFISARRASERLSFLWTPISKCDDLPCLECAWKVLFACAVALCWSRWKLIFKHGLNAERTCTFAAPQEACCAAWPHPSFCCGLMRHRRSGSKLASNRDFAHWDRAINASSCLVLSWPVLTHFDTSAETKKYALLTGADPQGTLIQV